jgi:hypothetical protein
MWSKILQENNHFSRNCMTLQPSNVGEAPLLKTTYVCMCIVSSVSFLSQTRPEPMSCILLGSARAVQSHLCVAPRNPYLTCIHFRRKSKGAEWFIRRLRIRGYVYKHECLRVATEARLITTKQKQKKKVLQIISLIWMIKTSRENMQRKMLGIRYTCKR